MVSTRRRCLLVWLSLLLGSGVSLTAAEPDVVSIPWLQTTFVPGTGCQWQSPMRSLRSLEHNAHYLAPPAPTGDWEPWYQKMLEYRQEVRSQLHATRPGHLTMNFQGVRSWFRVATDWGYAADVKPGEAISLQGRARWRQGNSQLCLAFDFCDRTLDDPGTWRGWSTVLATAEVPRDGQWHSFAIETRVPEFDNAAHWARPILGMDGTYNAEPGLIELTDVRVVLPAIPSRRTRLDDLLENTARHPAFDEAIYQREDLQWMTRNFVCGFLFMYDRSFWDPDQAGYQVEQVCDTARREFGGFDSVVLWHDYPRIGADDRNQFDFFRHMPGGLSGLRQVVDRFRERGVRVFIPYMPWDTGTRRDPLPDQDVLADVLHQLNADGVFLDTMLQAPLELRDKVDALRPGVAFAPEGHPAIAELEQCSGSWAQWLQAYPRIGVLHLKWIEPRHMQHQIRRWDASHQNELAAAWLNGSGVLVWENVFGSFNPWPAQDRADLRRMAPVWRRFASLLASENWRPCVPTEQDQLVASSWRDEQYELFTFVNCGEQSIREKTILRLGDDGRKFFDLWRGEPISTERDRGELRVIFPVDRYSAVLAVDAETIPGTVQSLLSRQRDQAAREIPPSHEDPHVACRSVIQAQRGVQASFVAPKQSDGMLSVDGGRRAFVVRHMRRECGCYPDPGTPSSEWSRFLVGNPHDSTLEHHIATDVEPCRIDAQPVSNGQFARFLKDTGYRPNCETNFLRHWGGRECPQELRNDPVVYVDLDDARAYAKWAGKSLPTEWQWQAAAEDGGERFLHRRVHEWTESYRDDGHTRFVMLRGGCDYQAKGSIWYFPGGRQQIDSHAKFILMYPGLDRCATIGFRCVARPVAEPK
jgi:hypothetical protein